MEELAAEGELTWAAGYDGPAREDLAALESLTAPLLDALLRTGRLPADAGLDALLALAYRQTLPGSDSLGQAWLELLDTIRAHPDAGLADVPPARTD
jgi:hypothetical protein